MKQDDIILLIVSVFFSIVLSVIASKYIFSNSKKFSQQVDVVPSISANFPAPNSKYFNSQAIDPTQLINISPGNNPNPL